MPIFTTTEYVAAMSIGMALTVVTGSDPATSDATGVQDQIPVTVSSA